MPGGGEEAGGGRCRTRKLQVASLLLSLLSVTAAASLQEDNSEGEGRFLFANYTSGEAPSLAVRFSHLRSDWQVCWL